MTEIVPKGGRYKMEKRSQAQTQMDEYLAGCELVRKRIPHDGCCLFRAVAEHVYSTQAQHPAVRSQCVRFMQNEREEFEPFIDGTSFEEYLKAIRKPSSWGGELEIRAMCKLYGLCFKIFVNTTEPPKIYRPEKAEKEIILVFDQDNHYDLAYPLETFKDMTDCQNIVFDMIRKVSGEDNNEYRRDEYKNIEWGIWISAENETIEADKKIAEQLAERKNKNEVPRQQKESPVSKQDADKKLQAELQRSFDEEGSIRPSYNNDGWQPTGRGRRGGRGRMHNDRREPNARVSRAGARSAPAAKPNMFDKSMFPDMGMGSKMTKSESSTKDGAKGAWSAVVARGTESEKKEENTLDGKKDDAAAQIIFGSFNNDVVAALSGEGEVEEDDEINNAAGMAPADGQHMFMPQQVPHMIPPMYYPQMMIDPRLMYQSNGGYQYPYPMVPANWAMGDPNMQVHMTPPPVHHFTPADLYKTKLCISFMNNGTCRMGSSCKFAHGVNELRGVDQDLVKPGGNGQNPRVCFRCQERGHVQRDCPHRGPYSENEKNNGPPLDTPEEGIDPNGVPPPFKKAFMGLCFNCHQPGHVARYCPNVRQQCGRCGMVGHDAANCNNGNYGVPNQGEYVYPGMMAPPFQASYQAGPGMQ